MRKILLVFITVLGLTASLYAQERTITGKVTDAKDGSTLPGVSVGIKGTSSGAITDIDGKYSITVPSDETVLVFTFVGYIQQEITVGAMSVVDLQLASDVKVLKDVVITANAIEKERRGLGYALTEIKNEDLVKGSERSFINSMQGKTSGIFIQNNGGGSVGGSSRIVIRGGTSITGNNQPLFVVDGIPIDNSSFNTGDNLNNQVDAGNRANDINPDDIEAVTILKGPAAAALYGARASNGAIIITTKSGKAGKNKKMEISYNTSYTFETPLKLPDLQNEYGQGLYKAPDLRENTSWGEKFHGRMQPWGKVINGYQRVKPYEALPNNMKDFFDIGHTFTNNLSLGGGNQQSNYYFSFGDLKQNGIMPGTEYKRTSIRVSGGTQLSNKFSASSSVNYIRSGGVLSVQGQGNSSAYAQILQTPRDISLLELKDINDPFNDDNGYYSPYTVNPWKNIKKNFYRNTVDRLVGNIQLSYKPMNWLDITYRLGTDTYSDKRRQGREISDPSGSNADKKDPGFYRESTYNVRELTSDLMLTVKKDLSENIGFTALIGQNIRQRDYSEQVSTINDLAVEGLFTLSNSKSRAITTNQIQLRRLYGFYTDINFSFKKYLFLGFTGRNDWSSTLPKNANSFFYSSANASFVFTDALNIQSKVLNYGKIRVNFAQVGNDPDPYQLITYFQTARAEDGYNNSEIRFPINQVPGLTIQNSQSNPEIKPEITQSFEVGLDLNLLNERVKIEATYYSKASKNQILSIDVPYASGYGDRLVNAGVLTNKGVEAMLSLTPISMGNGFKWDITFNYSQNISLVKELLPGVKKISLSAPGSGLGGSPLYAEEGQPYGTIYSNTELRDPEGRIVVDQDKGYPIQSPQPLPMGNIQPKFLAGISNTFTYKGIALSVVFDTRQGGIMYSDTKHNVEFSGISPITLYNDREPFVIPNSVYLDGSGNYVENTTPIEDVTTYWTSSSNRPASNAIIDASYIKLREVSFSYKLPVGWLKKTPFGSIQVGVVGRNLFIWTPRTQEDGIFSRKNNIYIDPEVSSFGNTSAQGYEFTAIPSVKSYGVNVRLTF